jgi:hypothetical protein
LTVAAACGEAGTQDDLTVHQVMAYLAASHAVAGGAD